MTKDRDHNIKPQNTTKIENNFYKIQIIYLQIDNKNIKRIQVEKM